MFSPIMLHYRAAYLALFELVWFRFTFPFAILPSRSRSTTLTPHRLPTPPHRRPSVRDECFAAEQPPTKLCDVHRGPLVSDRCALRSSACTLQHTAYSHRHALTQNQFGSTMVRQKPHVPSHSRWPSRPSCCILHVTSIASVFV